jgi:hypothetical protein
MAVASALMFAGLAVLAIRSPLGQALVDSLADAPNAHAAADDVRNIATSLLANAAQGSLQFGFFLITGAWLAGAGRRATMWRRAAAYPMRVQPGVVRGGLGALLLLLVVWGPVRAPSASGPW